ncbi:MAG: alpha/beta hydrolase [Sphingomonadales bacterium]|nr:MAG: alpha/beta hydrolase [Sphingomonadales bacterium]
MEKVFFTSEGAQCAAFLGIPKGAAGTRHPAIVLGHGFGIRKESLVDEAEYLTAAGYLTLAIDYRSLGESEGEPRGSIFPLNQVDDFRNAISFLQRRDDVDPDRVGIWGASFGGGVVIMTAAIDRRVKCVVAMAPIINGKRWLDSVWGGSRFQMLREIVEADRERRFDGAVSGRLTLGADDLPAVLPLDERGGRQHLRSMAERGKPLLEGTPEISIHSVEKVIEWEPDRFIDLVSPTPLLVVTPGQWDIMHRFDHIREAWPRAGEPRKLIPLACEQMEVYLPPWQTTALEHAEAWFKEYL